MLSHPLFRASWPLYNYKTGYELAYQENKAYNCKLAAKVLDKLIVNVTTWFLLAALIVPP